MAAARVLAFGGARSQEYKVLRGIVRTQSSLLVPIYMVLVLAWMGCPVSNGGSDSDPGSRTDRSQPISQNRPVAGEFQWPSDPDRLLMKVEVATKNAEGTIEIELMPELAPESVDQMVRLAREGHYDGTTFHRVIRGFMIQGGDPNSRDQDPANDGKGGASVIIPDEFSRAPFERGVVALANRGRKGSNSSQFFILQADHRDLDGRYNAVGRVIRGLELVDSIADTPTDKVGRWGPKDRPIENVSIRHVKVSASIEPGLPGEPASIVPTAVPLPPLSRNSSAPTEMSPLPGSVSPAPP